MTDTPKPGAEPLSLAECFEYTAFCTKCERGWSVSGESKHVECQCGYMASAHGSLSEPRVAAMLTERDATIAALKGQVAALTKICTVPGTWHCAKCGFVVQKMILDAHTGAVGVKPDTVTEPCPNGCGPLWPQTERARANALYDDANRFLDERDALRKEVAELRAENADLISHLPSNTKWGKP